MGLTAIKILPIIVVAVVKLKVVAVVVVIVKVIIIEVLLVIILMITVLKIVSAIDEMNQILHWRSISHFVLIVIPNSFLIFKSHMTFINHRHLISSDLQLIHLQHQVLE